jgi:hypothetical protein
MFLARLAGNANRSNASATGGRVDSLPPLSGFENDRPRDSRILERGEHEGSRLTHLAETLGQEFGVAVP